MTTFQLDKAINSKELAKLCTQEGLCSVYRLPASHHAADDCKILEYVISRSTPLLTSDHTIHTDKENVACFPDIHPGVIIVRNGPSCPKSLGIEHVKQIFRKFKQEFPRWHRTSWSNSIVQITQDDIYMWHKEDGVLVENGYRSRTDADWRDWMTRELNSNASIENE